MIDIIDGDLLEAKEQYICHQLNCVSNNSAGLATLIFNQFPYSNIYKERKNPDEPGKIIISGNGQDQRYVIGMLAQYYPGYYYDLDIDNEQQRRKYFYNCLKEISKIENLESIAFPYNIGCGLAGGNWEEYYKMINVFSDYIAKKNVKVSIYKLGDLK